MTGLERLRSFARRMSDFSVWPGGEKLLDIAEQIEREERDVRDEALRTSVVRRSMDNIEQELREGIESIAEALGVKLDIQELKISAVCPFIVREIERRVMPEGYEWPRYTDGKPVMIGDKIIDDDELPEWSEADTIIFQRDNGTYVVEIENKRGVSQLYGPGQRIERPKTEVLAADGEPIEVGQTVWHGAYGKCSVSHTGGHDGTVRIVHDNSGVWVEPSTLTHTKPEPPDSWERIEDDMKKSACEYLTGGKKKSGDGCPCPDDCPSLIADNMDVPCMSVMVRDIVRRCKALAGVSE